MKSLLFVYDYLVMIFGLLWLALLCLMWALISTLLYPLLPNDLRTRLGRRAAMLGFRFYLASLSLTGRCRFDLSELDQLRHAGPLILAPNHPCLLDAVMVISRLPNVACVMKGKLMGNVLLAPGARLAGYLPNESIQQMVHQACDDFARGSQLLLFPEGTRTTRRPINPFVGSVGLIARQARVPIQTIFIETDSPYLGKGWPLLRKPDLPIRYRVRLGKRFEPQNDLRRLTAELEIYFAQELQPPC
jgi:1-acyl-sn-glycerol-3-phosphate acyltransferase